VPRYEDIQCLMKYVMKTHRVPKYHVIQTSCD